MEVGGGLAMTNGGGLGDCLWGDCPGVLVGRNFCRGGGLGVPCSLGAAL